jgi:transcriptional regulator with XRE-family HTH domain
MMAKLSTASDLSVNTQRKVRRQFIAKAGEYTARGARLKQAREALGLTQVEVWERSGVTQATISSIETGVTQCVRMHTLCRLAGVLKVAPEWLENGEHPEHDAGEDEREMLKLYRALPTHLRAAWIAAGDAMLRTKTGHNGGGKNRGSRPQKKPR